MPKGFSYRSIHSLRWTSEISLKTLGMCWNNLNDSWSSELQELTDTQMKCCSSECASECPPTHTDGCGVHACVCVWLWGLHICLHQETPPPFPRNPSYVCVWWAHYLQHFLNGDITEKSRHMRHCRRSSQHATADTGRTAEEQHTLACVRACMCVCVCDGFLWSRQTESIHTISTTSSWKIQQTSS